MAYHADYWMLAGVTSAIVALAAIVAAGSSVVALSGDRRLAARFLKGITYFLCLVNVALQVVVAQAALTSLAGSNDADPLHATTDHVITQLGLLLASLFVRVLTEAYKPRVRGRGLDRAAAVVVGTPEPEPEAGAT
jgi:hypothetical protein